MEVKNKILSKILKHDYLLKSKEIDFINENSEIVALIYLISAIDTIEVIKKS